MSNKYYNQKLLEKQKEYTIVIGGRGIAKTKAMQEYYNKFIKEKEND